MAQELLDKDALEPDDMVTIEAKVFTFPPFPSAHPISPLKYFISYQYALITKAALQACVLVHVRDDCESRHDLCATGLAGQAGSILIFPGTTPHRSLNSVSENIRWSCDFRLHRKEVPLHNIFMYLESCLV